MIWTLGEGDPYRLLAQLLGEPPPRIEREERGKPFFPERPGIHFSLSHTRLSPTRSLSLCALANRPVGCDVEAVRSRTPGLFRYALSAREFRWLEERGENWADFYTLWTLKEARVKCTGEGLRLPPRDIHVPLLEPGEETCFDGFRFLSLSGVNWRGALVGRPA